MWLTENPFVIGILISNTTICAKKYDVTGTGCDGEHKIDPILYIGLTELFITKKYVLKQVSYLSWIMSNSVNVIKTESPATAHFEDSLFISKPLN